MGRRGFAAEKNPERNALYQLCWHLGASQGDIASLKAEDVDWTNGTISFTRRKTGVPVVVHLGSDVLNLLRDLLGEGPLLPYLAQARAGDRATGFGQRSHQLGNQGSNLARLSVRVGERVKVACFPERFAQEALGHKSRAVHQALRQASAHEDPLTSKIRGTLSGNNTVTIQLTELRACVISPELQI